MKKKQPSKKQLEVKHQSSQPIEEEEEVPKDKRGRQDNSLSVLTKKFIELIMNSQNGTIDLNVAVQQLDVQKRRIYDITNVLEGINYVEKVQKNTIRWIGGKEDPEIERQVIQMKKKIEEMMKEEESLDQQIAQTNEQIMEQFVENVQSMPYQFITYEDCVGICKSMTKSDPTKGILVISAPKGSGLEVAEEEKGECKLKLDATQKGDIKVFSCKLSDGVKEVQVARKP